MPSGQLAIRIDIAVTISLPANQSVIILVSRIDIAMPPTPLTRRPATASASRSDAVMTPPKTISARLTRTICLAPKRWPSTPLGSATTAPGSM